MHTPTLLLALVLAGSALPALAELPSYAPPQLQARSNLLVNDNGYNLPPGSSFNSITADIDDAGRVAFAVQVVPDGASSTPGIWFGGNGSGSIVFRGPVDALVSSAVRMNDAGQVVFTLVETGSADGIYRYDDALQSAERIGTAPVFPSSYSSAAINNSGDIGFQGSFGSGRGHASRAAAGGAALHVVDRSVDPGSSYTYLYTPNFDDARTIVAKVATSADFTTATEIRRFASDGNSTRLAANRGTDAASPIRQFDNSVGVSDSGRVAFVATRFADNRRVVYRVDGAALSEIAVVDPAGLVREIDAFPPAITDAGLVAFRGKDEDGQAIFVSDGTQLQRAVGKGDVLQTDLGKAQIGQNNSTDAVFAGAPSLNDTGDLAFVAALHPAGDNQVEWGSGVFVARASETIFADGFEQAL
ncbi:hypothetical protein DFR29_10744 [Tahibacter aquaticus]|uniref:6-phosphogluconolactonase (Cycloisomerase 2 family) n=1 Tax=Tahibacter aquaticus TaxID=520092 RepID=A0A4R6YW40_9GAMM|nr:hypothetical protein [Tahibacter aquaticus]TDR43040.1 hypothetical protein DFR29_10744 [Tahibacter aquaticus]